MQALAFILPRYSCLACTMMITTRMTCQQCGSMMMTSQMMLCCCGLTMVVRGPFICYYLPTIAHGSRVFCSLTRGLVLTCWVDLFETFYLGFWIYFLRDRRRDWCFIPTGFRPEDRICTRDKNARDGVRTRSLSMSGRALYR